MTTQIANLKISQRVRQSLIDANIASIEELTAVPRSKRIKGPGRLTNLGKVGWAELETLVATLNVQFAPEPVLTKKKPKGLTGQSHFARGYFCAVATALREEGETTLVRSLFKQGGDPMLADPEDRALFEAHGLIVEQST